jgi:hypothetical protein
VIERQLDAYNAQDAEAFAACFAPDARVFSSLGTVALEGRDQLRRHYAELFAGHADVRAESVHRRQVGSWVVDEERVTGLRAEVVRALAVHRVVAGLIVEAGYLR